MRTNLGLRFACALALVLNVGFAAACNKDNSTGPTVLPTLVTEKFTGTIAPLGTASHSFTVNYNLAGSDASITVTSLATVADNTPKTITIGVGFGNSNVGVCTRSASYSNPAAPFNTELPTSGAPFTAGLYCVQIFDNPDSSTVTEPLTYAITVKHY